MPVSFSLFLRHTLKGGGNLICEPQKHLHDLKMNVPSPEVFCTFPHRVFKELWVIASSLKFEAEQVSPLRSTPPPPTAKANLGIAPNPWTSARRRRLAQQPQQFLHLPSIGCPLIINALMPLHYIVGFENLKYG